ncbi:MAG: hypothetical protein Q9216_003701 [Gyalolechia sp. 2 TL-2023]
MFSSSQGQSLVENTVCFLAKQDEYLTPILSGDFFSITTICAIHGLGGNAFDTWMGEKNMWLRDILPQIPPFDRARVMIYGYDSTLINKKCNDRIKDWADDLLYQLGHVRTSARESQRSILFICHSLGGIVAREAMIRLHRYSKNYDGVRLKLCGLVFLSTPHSGTTEADWNQFLSNLSEATLGVRSHAIVDELRSFNPSSVDSEEAFAAMSKIVTQASAGFYGHKADKILNVDHHQICKFDTPFSPAYLNVLAHLKKIRTLLLSRISGEMFDESAAQNIPGQAPIVAPRYPLNESSKWYEGSNLRNSSRLIGRTATLQDVIESLEQNDTQPRIIALTGVGGIG